MRLRFRTSISLALALLAILLIHPTLRAQSIAETCVDALATEGTRWDGLPMDTFIWDGTPITAGTIETAEITVCRASGPLEILPPIQFIGCVLVDGQLVSIDGLLGCGAYREIRPDPEGALLWIARSGAATNEVGRLIWNGSGFDRERSYTACWDDPLTTVADPFDCGR